MQERSNILLKIADRIEQNLELLAVTETWDNGKAVRETLNADIPWPPTTSATSPAASAPRKAPPPRSTTAPWPTTSTSPGRGRADYPVELPLLMAAWKLAPALAAGNCVVLKPAEQTPLGICVLLELIGDLLPPGVLNVVRASAGEAGEALATSKRIARSPSPVPPRSARTSSSVRRRTSFPPPSSWAARANIYFEDIMQAEPAFIEGRRGPGAGLLQPGRGVHLPVRALVRSRSTRRSWRVLKKVRAIKRGDPLDTETMVGAQASQQQYERSSPTSTSPSRKAPKCSPAAASKLEGNLASGCYIQPTLLKGHNKMRVFQEEIFGPVVGVTTFKDEAEALARQRHRTASAPASGPATSTAPCMGRGIKAGRVWTSCYHLYPAHAAFGGYKSPASVARRTR